MSSLQRHVSHWPAAAKALFVIVCAASASAAITLPSMPAQACSFAFGALPVTRQILPDGVMVFEQYCPADCSASEIPTQASLRDILTNEELGATVETLRSKGSNAFFIVRPGRVLTAGAQVEVRLLDGSAGDLPSVHAIDVIADPGIDLPAWIEQEMHLSATEQTVKSVECEIDPTSSCATEGTKQVPTEVVTLPQLELLTPEPLLSRFSFRASFWTESTAEELVGPDFSPSLRFTFPIVADAYCYRVEAKPYDPAAAPVVVEGCVPHSLGEIGEPATASERLQRAEVNDCVRPPEELVALWCDEARQRSACGGGNAFVDCEAYERLCKDPATEADAGGVEPADGSVVRVPSGRVCSAFWPRGTASSSYGGAWYGILACGYLRLRRRTKKQREAAKRRLI